MAVQSMNFFQVNGQGSYDCMCDLGVNMRRMNVRITLLQEPYVDVRNGCVKGLPTDMKVFLNKCGRSAIVVDDVNVECMLMNELSGDWGVCVLLQGVFGRIYVVSVYMKFNEPIEPYIVYLDRVNDELRNECVLIGMDANAASPYWHSKGVLRHNVRARGRLLEDWIERSWMYVLNEYSDVFTFCGPAGQSDIDVTVMSRECERFNFEWKVMDDCGLSDHNYILISSGEIVDVPQVIRGKRWMTKDVDWNIYIQDMIEKANDMTMDEFERLSVDGKIARVNVWMNAVNEVHLKKCGKKNDRSVKWWSDDLQRMKVCVNRLRARFQNDRRMGVCEEQSSRRYRAKRKEYGSAIRDAKLSHWKNFVSEEGNENPWGQVYKFCRGKKRMNDICSLKIGVNECTKDWKESVNVLMNGFFPGDPNNQIADFAVDRHPAAPSWEEVNTAVFRSGCRKAPGLDGVNGEIMRGLWSSIPDHLLSLYGQCMNESYFPNEWKVGNVVILLKSPDKERNNPRSYRPICLLSVLGKVLERIMVARLNEKRENVNANQFGFTVGRSTEDAWMKARENVETDDRRFVYGIFVDFKGAFDNLLWNRVIESINELGCDEIGLWRSYFQNRSACVNGVNETVSRVVQRGCPQGSICGPTVWNLLMNNLLNELDERGFRCVAFADDLLVTAGGYLRVDVERAIKECMDIVTEWGRNVGVDVAYDKTVCMKLKGKKVIRPPSVFLGMNGTERVFLKYASEVKYLGISMNENFDFRVHLKRTREKMVRVVGMLRRILRKEYGLRERATRTICKGVFNACAMYGAIVWYETGVNQYGRMILNGGQRVALSACIRVCRTVSTDAMQVLMGELPWDLLSLQRAMFTKIRRGIALVETDPISANDLIGMSAKESRVYVMNVINEMWQRRWERSVNGRCTYEFICDVNFVSRSDWFEFGLELGFLLTGHGSLNEFLCKRGLADTSECLCGFAMEDWKHVLGECVIYRDIRKLNEWGIFVENGGLNVRRALDTRERVGALNVFAREVFARRAALLGDG